jgi:hypothetical protein
VIEIPPFIVTLNLLLIKSDTTFKGGVRLAELLPRTHDG